MHLWKTPVFLTAATLLLLFNFFCLIQKTVEMRQIRKRVPYTFAGDRFRGLDALVGKTPYLGYYTDKNLDDNRSAMQFAQAQFVLAPAILDLNNTGHEFILFDCTSPLAAIKKIQEIGAQPLKANRYGIILARHPDIGIVHQKADVQTFDRAVQKQRP